MLKIEFYFSPATIELENSRGPNLLTRDELLNWTFAVRINFTDDESGQSMLLLPDASLFQILHGLAIARKQTAGHAKEAINMRDREGGYDLSVKVGGDAVEINDLFSGQGFVVSPDEFREATGSFLPLALKEAKTHFPTLQSNKSFKQLEVEILESLTQ